MKQEIIAILADLRPEFDFSEQGVDFIEEGMLDSFDVVTLVDELEEKFDIKIDGVDVVSANFSSIEKIEALINKSSARQWT